MANEIANAGFYADFGALTSLGKQAKQNDPQAIREAARQFESLFTGMMLKSMRAAKLGDGMGDSQESDFYQDMYDQQLAVQMSQGKGLGLAEMLVQQLTRAGASGAPAAASSQASGSVTGAAAPATVDSAAASATRPAAASPAATSVHAAVSHAATPRTPRGSSGASLQQRIGFIQKIVPYAQRAAAALGVSVNTLIAQAALETGWGQHVVQAGAGASSNNLFGVKAGGAWQGTTASATTTEYSDGSAQHIAQAFRSYASVEQGVNDYVSLLKGRAAYAGALGSGANAGAFASALQHGGYATDPDYVRKLVATSATVRSLRAFKLVAGVPIQGDEQPG